MHLRTKRTHLRTLTTALAMGAALLVPGAPAQAAEAGTAAQDSPGHRSWSDTPHGFASLAGGTTGGLGGKVVTVSTQADLAKYAGAEGPHIIRVAGSLAVEPFGSDIDVTSDKTIVGVGDTAEIDLDLNRPSALCRSLFPVSGRSPDRNGRVEQPCWTES